MYEFKGHITELPDGPSTAVIEVKPEDWTEMVNICSRSQNHDLGTCDCRSCRIIRQLWVWYDNCRDLDLCPGCEVDNFKWTPPLSAGLASLFYMFRASFDEDERAVAAGLDPDEMRGGDF